MRTCPGIHENERVKRDLVPIGDHGIERVSLWKDPKGRRFSPKQKYPAFCAGHFSDTEGLPGKTPFSALAVPFLLDGALINSRSEQSLPSKSMETRPCKSPVHNDISREGTDDVSRNMDNVEPVYPDNRMDYRNGAADKTVMHHKPGRANDRMHTSRQWELTSLNSKCLIAIF